MTAMTAVVSSHGTTSSSTRLREIVYSNQETLTIGSSSWTPWDHRIMWELLHSTIHPHAMLTLLLTEMFPHRHRHLLPSAQATS